MLLKIIEKSLNCFHPHTEYKKYLEFNFPKNDILLSKAKKRGVDMAKKVNVRNPSGKIRDLDQLQQIVEVHLLKYVQNFF